MKQLLPACLIALAGCAQAPDPEVPPTRRGHIGPVTGLACLGEELVSCSQAGVRIGTRPLLQLPWRPVCVATHPTRPDIWIAGGVVGERGQIARLDPGGTIQASRGLGEDLVYALAIHPSEPWLAVGTASGQVQLLDARDLRPLRSLQGHRNNVRQLAFAPAGDRLVSAGRDGLLRCHDLQGDEHLELGQHLRGVESLLIRSEAGRSYIYSGALDGRVRVHDLYSGRLLRNLPVLDSPVVGLVPGPAAQGFWALCQDGELFAAEASGWNPRGSAPGPCFAALRCPAGGGVRVGATGRVGNISQGQGDPGDKSGTSP